MPQPRVDRRSVSRLDAIFARSDLTAMTVINALIRKGKRVPDDVLVAGYDDIELASYFRPALTTVRQPMEQAAETIVDALIEQLKGDRPNSYRLVTELVRRESARMSNPPEIPDGAGAVETRIQ